MTHAHPPHDHDHDHHDHAPADVSAGRLRGALLITLAFAAVEAVGGVWSGSLALLADAGHMATDALSLMLALMAAVAGRRPADAAHSYGHARFRVLATFVNGLTLWLLALWIVVEAVQRLQSPSEILGLPMLAVAALGLIANLIALRLLHGGHGHTDMNVQAAAAHVIGDLLGSVAALLAAGIVMWTGWTPIDPLLSMVVAGLIATTGWRFVRDSGHVLLEGAPPGFDAAALSAELPAKIAGVQSIHHVHAWMLMPGHALLTLHVRIDADTDGDAILRELQHFVAERFGIDHVTAQLEREGCVDDAHACE